MTDQTPTHIETPPDTDTVIRKLQSKLLALGRDLGEETELDAVQIDRTAKAINQLINSVERAEDYLRDHGQVRPGDGLSKPDRRTLLLKIRRMVENGILSELDDE